MAKNITLLTLQTFSSTGGIQKMTRTLAHALNEIAQRNNIPFKLWSVYDNDSDLMSNYLPANNFKGFSGNRILFTLRSLKMAAQADVIIISHINLAFIGLLAKIINPKCQVWLIAHGIEVWRKLPSLKSAFIKNCDKVLCVSSFTRQEVIKLHNLNPDKCIVLNNALDPFITLPTTFDKPEYLIERYNLNTGDKILFTLTRMDSAEQYKGYEQVIKVAQQLKTRFANLKYILAGPYDVMEEARIKELIKQHDVANQVILTGFINENELTHHFLLADVFILPSKKEGFGIVFIEALACGLPVICSNVDGSVDAIKHGELGMAVDPDDLDALQNAVTSYLETPLTTALRSNLQQKCLHYFSEANYQQALQKLLIDEPRS